MSENQNENRIELAVNEVRHGKDLGTVNVDYGPAYRRTVRALIAGKAVQWGELLLKFPNSRAERHARNSVTARANLNIPLPQERIFSVVPASSLEGIGILNTAMVRAAANPAVVRSRARERTRLFLLKGHDTLTT